MDEKSGTHDRYLGRSPLVTVDVPTCKLQTETAEADFDLSLLNDLPCCHGYRIWRDPVT